MHEGLGALVVLGWPALNKVAGQRERRANEADERLGFGQLGQDAGDALGDLGDVGLQQRQLADVLPTPHRLLHHRPAPRHDIDLDARGLERDNNIGEQDGGVNVVAAHRLQGNFCQQFRHEAGIEHANPLAGGAVLRQRAAGLAHEPDWGAGGGAAEGGVDKRGTIESRHAPIMNQKLE